MIGRPASAGKKAAEVAPLHANQTRPGCPRPALLAVTAALVGSVALAPLTAMADPISELQGAQQQVQQANEAYSQANQRVSELQGQIDQNRERAEQIQGQLPVLRERASQSMRVLYKMQQSSGGLVELILSAESFNDLVATIQHLGIIQSHNTEALGELAAAAEELQQVDDSLQAQMGEASAQQQAASDALEQATQARSRLQAQVEAQAAAEEAERQAALDSAQQDAGGDFTTESGNKAPVEVPSKPSPGPVETPSDRDAFIAMWAPRIDAYMAGSPMAGTGRTFAEAAWEYGVDPRFSPAISMVESSQGRYCFRPHNAWGWGNSSWSSWDEAIWAHVRGLAIGYGGQLTYEAAKKYCPPNAAHWYSSVLANMERI